MLLFNDVKSSIFIFLKQNSQTMIQENLTFLVVL